MGKAILLVRDRTDFAERLTAALKSADVDAEIVLSSNAIHAARLFEEGGRFCEDELPAMVVVPPVVDVLSLLETLRSRKRTRAIPVFVVRALVPPEPPA